MLDNVILKNFAKLLVKKKCNSLFMQFVVPGLQNGWEPFHMLISCGHVHEMLILTICPVCFSVAFVLTGLFVEILFHMINTDPCYMHFSFSSKAEEKWFSFNCVCLWKHRYLNFSCSWIFQCFPLRPLSFVYCLESSSPSQNWMGKKKKTPPKDLNKHLFRVDMQMDNKYMRRCLISLTRREMPIKTTMRYHILSTRIVIIKKC